MKFFFVRESNVVLCNLLYWILATDGWREQSVHTCVWFLLKSISGHTLRIHAICTRICTFQKLVFWRDYSYWGYWSLLIVSSVCFSTCNSFEESNKTTQPEKEDWIQKEIQKTKGIKNNHDFLILSIRFCVGSCILLSFLSFFLFSYSSIRTKQILNKINAISYKKKTIIINSKINRG